MNYIEVKMRMNPNEEYVSDVLSALLGEIGYESFVREADCLKAYVSSSLFDEEKLKILLNSFPLNALVEYTYQQMENKNWNEEWEKHYFEPIILSDKCVIHSSFHKEVPAAKYDILIDPKMSFGTGHHETTSLMLEELLASDVEGKTLLDMGCGTAVLAILAKMMGAGWVDAVDIDEWAYDNALENVRLNSVKDIQVQLGGAELLPKVETYDIVLANINRNILLNDMNVYVACMKKGAELYMSGFYVEDIPVIRKEAERNGLEYVCFRSKQNWVVIEFKK